MKSPILGRAACVAATAIVGMLFGLGTSQASAAQCTVEGNGKDNTLSGTPGDDVICGGGGDDTLKGKGGDDELIGGSGNDEASGAGGKDDITGNKGKDELSGASGEDSLEGGSGDDALDGGAAADVIDGGSGNNTCTIDELDVVVGGCDVEAPQLAAFSLSPGSVDTSSGAQVIDVTARLTDNLSGVKEQGSSGFVRFAAPGGDVTVDASFLPGTRVSGDSKDGVYVAEMTIPAHSPTGTWTVEQFWIYDEAGNAASLDAADLAGAGFPTSFNQTGPGDEDPPQITELSITPASVDTSSGPASVTVTARIVDTLAGAGSPQGSGTVALLRFYSPSKNQIVDAVMDGGDRVSGSAQDGVYTVSITVPRYAEQGVWEIDASTLYDAAGNTRTVNAASLSAAGLPTGFTQAGAGDTAGPVVDGLDLGSAQVDTRSQADSLTVTLDLTDDLAGIGSPESPSVAFARFSSPSDGQTVDALFNKDDRLSGTALDATYRSKMTVPKFSECGVWQLDYVAAYDRAGNASFTSAGALPPGSHETFTNC
jgi:hypothetical protein